MVVAEALVKVFAGRRVVDEVSFRVGSGEVVGLVGPNGAGKSTTLSMVSGLVRPDGGRAWVAGHDVAREPTPVHRAVGLVFQEPVLYEALTGRENLRFHAGLFGLRGRERVARIEGVLELVQLSDRADDRVSTYSGGMKRRLGLARALVHDPPVVMLDEPTLGIDVQTRAAIWGHVRHVRDQGRTVLVCTNYMDEAEALADRLVVLDRGVVRAQGSPGELRDLASGEGESMTMDDVFLTLTGRDLRD